MATELQDAYAWLTDQQNRPEIEYLLHILKQHQELLSRQAELTEETRRNREATREISIKLDAATEAFNDVEEQKQKAWSELRILNGLYKRQGSKLAQAEHALEDVKEFLTKMELHLGSSN